MNNNIGVYTKTMAKVYFDQGHFDRAVEIYRHLMEKEPGREDLKKSLARAEEMLAEQNRKRFEDLVPLFRQWVHLAVRYNTLNKMKELSERGFPMGRGLPSSLKLRRAKED